jgi:protein gp37
LTFLQDLGGKTVLILKEIHWVIMGGESGAGARPMKEEWVISIRQQCRTGRVPFFFKQWGGIRKSETGRELHGKTFDEMPKRAERPILSRDERRVIIESLPVWTSTAMSGIGSPC